MTLREAIADAIYGPPWRDDAVGRRAALSTADRVLDAMRDGYTNEIGLAGQRAISRGPAKEFWPRIWQAMIDATKAEAVDKPA